MDICINRCTKIRNNPDDPFNKNIGYNVCLWMCHAKLDNRYKNYWTNQRNGLIERHRNKKYENFISELEQL